MTEPKNRRVDFPPAVFCLSWTRVGDLFWPLAVTARRRYTRANARQPQRWLFPASAHFGDMDQITPPTGQSALSVHRAGLLAGPTLFALAMILPAPAGMPPLAWAAAAMALWMAVWWASEAVPLAATAPLAIVLQPLLGIASTQAAAAPFAHPLIFLFLAGFWLALAMQRWNLHRRIALAIVARAGNRPRRLVGGAMLATAFLSMWISNTATAMMMMPIAASLVTVIHWDSGEFRAGDKGNFATSIMLGIAYAASIGGMATLIGSPPNALMASFMGQSFGVEVSFARWMAVALPVASCLLPVCWLVLTRLVYPVGDIAHAASENALTQARMDLGPVSAPEKRVAVVIALVAVFWVFGPLMAGFAGLPVLADAVIALIGAVALFALPTGLGDGKRLLEWEWARRAPFDVLLLVGGGLSLASAIESSGLAAWLAGALGDLAGAPALILVMAVVAVIVLLTELTSNTATTAAFLPLVAASAVAAGLEPILLAAPVAMAASCAFMLPVATPPNAIVYASGHVTMAQMIRAGAWMNLAGIACITLLAYLLVPLVFDPR